jgi:hypothetical protein
MLCSWVFVFATCEHLVKLTFLCLFFSSFCFSLTFFVYFHCEAGTPGFPLEIHAQRCRCALFTSAEAVVLVNPKYQQFSLILAFAAYSGPLAF